MQNSGDSATCVLVDRHPYLAINLRSQELSGLYPGIDMGGPERSHSDLESVVVLRSVAGATCPLNNSVE